MQQQPQFNVFEFSRNERRGMGILLLIAGVLLGGRWMYQHQPVKPVPVADSIWQTVHNWPSPEETDHSAREENTLYRADHFSENPMKAELFHFDPNTLDSAGWRRLGIRDKTIRSIIKYRSKGGRFKTAEDIRKIWGIPPSLQNRLVPYVRIAAAATASFERNYNHVAPRKLITDLPRTIDINQADSIAWEALPGIGPALAARILRFREKLGGFYSVSQVAETFGLPDSVFRRIRPNLQLQDYPVQKISINESDLSVLAAHPYIRYKLARLLINYRTQHGPFKQPQELLAIPLCNDSLIRKLTPYLHF